MRILLTSNYKIGNETGSSQMTDLLAFNLSLKNEVLYLCLGEKYSIKNFNKNLKIVKIPSTELNNIAIPLITPNLILDVEEVVSKFNPEIIHTQNSVMISKLVQVWASQKKIPVVTTFHHIPTQAIRHLLPSLSKNVFTKLVEDLYTQTSIKSFLKNINGVIALNENQKSEIKKVDNKIKIEVINNGLDLSKFKMKSKKRLTKNINFIFTGSYIERKNQEFLLKTFSYLSKNYILSCYGKIDSNKGYFKRLKMIKPQNVSLYDYTKDVPKTLKKSDFFVSASLKEVQSLSVIQAMAVGLPVIGLENETISELINNTNGLKLKRNTSPKMFAKKLTKFVEGINYQKVSTKVKRDAQKFDIKKVVIKIERFYKEVISDTAFNAVKPS